MKKFCVPAIVLLILACSACNNSTKKDSKDSAQKTDSLQSPADSLMADVMEGHDVGMAKMGKLKIMENQVQRMIDSIEMLPRKTKMALRPIKIKMDSLLADLKSAKNGMEKWMDEFNMDSSVNNMEQRIKYLSEEKLKVSKVKENILLGLQRADSLIRTKL